MMSSTEALAEKVQELARLVQDLARIEASRYERNNNLLNAVDDETRRIEKEANAIANMIGAS